MKEQELIGLVPIGIIHSPYSQPADAPRQGILSGDIMELEIFDAYHPGLEGLEAYERVVVLYWLDRADRKTLKATPPGTQRERGVFSTRSPHRPNPIGIGIAELIGISGNRITVRGLDAIDMTPLLDIKPYSPQIDHV